MHPCLSRYMLKVQSHCLEQNKIIWNTNRIVFGLEILGKRLFYLFFVSSLKLKVPSPINLLCTEYSFGSADGLHVENIQKQVQSLSISSQMLLISIQFCLCHKEIDADQLKQKCPLVLLPPVNSFSVYALHKTATFQQFNNKYFICIRVVLCFRLEQFQQRGFFFFY